MTYPTDPACNLDEGRSFDSTTEEYVYVVICVNPGHSGRERCPDEHEMFRVARSEMPA